MLRSFVAKCLSEYGMVVVLVLLCAYYAWATLERRAGVGTAGGDDCASQLLAKLPAAKYVVIIAGHDSDDAAFIQAAKTRLEKGGVASIDVVDGEPPIARKSLLEIIAGGKRPDAILSTAACGEWLPRVLDRLPSLSAVPVITPGAYRWPTFLTSSNLLNVANQIVVIAVMAVGMTMVIITGGIDLSVGSLVALSAVVTAMLIRDHAGGANASASGMIGCSLVGVLVCGAVGAFSGGMITLFNVPPFITTLAMMQVASGLAYILAAGQSIYDIPSSFTWLGRGIGALGIPNAVWLMLAVFAVAHITMSRTRLGRYIYAVGGNAEAARLSGVRVGRVLMIAYIISGLAAGLGGVIVASQLKSSSPTYGLSYELYVIAAVVVGGTSLAGGEGNIIGTLIGALIMAVIQNGMNLTGVEGYRQKVVLGFVILGAVLLDRLKRRSWRFPFWIQRSAPRPVEVVESAATNLTAE